MAEMFFKGKFYCVDATPAIYENSFGRLINHSVKKQVINLSYKFGIYKNIVKHINEEIASFFKTMGISSVQYCPFSNDRVYLL